MINLQDKKICEISFEMTKEEWMQLYESKKASFTSQDSHELIFYVGSNDEDHDFFVAQLEGHGRVQEVMQEAYKAGYHFVCIY